jgi:CelD/BcsL family acetyltransferase involved in cellulose biosynthesis
MDILVSLNTLPPLDELARMWKELQNRSEHSFFTSWAWIESWLETLPTNLTPLFLKGENNGQIVGAGIILRRTRRQFKLLGTPALYLHSTGDSELDAITIEYNGFLAERSRAPQIVEQFLTFLFVSHEHHCNELFIHGGQDPQTIRRIAPRGTRLLVPRVRQCYSVDLNTMRESGENYLATLSASRRYSIRRNLREYAKIGPLEVKTASSTSEAQSFLNELRKLHQAYWAQKQLPGAFTNPFFDKFIRHLIVKNFDNGVIQILRINAGIRAVGYLLNFVYEGRVYQYQSGFDYHICEKYNGPGYVSHMYGVEHNLKIGHHTYDYMAGDSAYKKAMGKPSAELSWQVVQRDTISFRLEDDIRQKVRSIRNRSKSRTHLESVTE